MPRIKAWYRKTHRDDDVVISASPQFLIAPACKALGIQAVMGSPVDRHTGMYSGINCHGAEKVRRFRAVYPDAVIENFKPGECVKVVSGPLRGLEGQVVRRGAETSLVLTVDILGRALEAAVSPSDLQKL